MVSYIFSIAKQDRSVLRYVFSCGAFGFGTMGTSAVLFNLYLVKLGYDLAFVAVLNAIAMGSFALMSFPASWIGLRVGLRGSMILGFSLLSLFFAIFLSVPWFPFPFRTVGLLITISVVYAAASIVVVNGSPYLMAICPEKDRHSAFALQTAVITLFAFLGALTAGFLPNFLIRQAGEKVSEASAYNAVMWLNAFGYFCAGLLLSKARPAPPLVTTTQNTEKDSIPSGLLIFMAVLFSLQISSENCLVMLFNIYLSNDLLVSTRLIGIIFGSSQLVPFLLTPLQPVALNRLGAGLTMNAGYIILAAGAVAMALIPSWGVAAVLYLLVKLVTNFTSTARNLFGQEAVQARWRTAAGAVVTISMATGAVLVGFTANQLVAATGFRGLFFSGAVLAIVSIVLYSVRAYHSWRVRHRAPGFQSTVFR